MEAMLEGKLTLLINSLVAQSFLTLDYVDRPLQSDVKSEWKVVEQYFTVVLLVFRFSHLCKFGTLGIERV